ncbi:hypothetical protein [Piscinibacter sp. XHJ-5]|uniref:hypothetical protein n=1 Tax=Piscinibacter sp. XHJ-5 TaxID=3037797 RepID=UPI00245301B0|nr:hypothetical protein [Piscinibacter sp. XHJ-5]
MANLYKVRTDFEKAMLKELGPLLKGGPWKRSQCALYGRFGDGYQDVFLSVYRDAARTIAELRIKPMALDPILWDILDIAENQC